MESELLKLKNNYEFWDLFFKLDNNEEISFNDLEYLIWSIIKLKYENLNNDEKIELKKSIVENRMIHCIQKFEQYFNKNYINGLIKEIKYREWFKLEGSHIIDSYYFIDPVNRYLKKILFEQLFEHTEVSDGGNKDFSEIGIDDFGTRFCVNYGVSEDKISLAQDYVYEYMENVKENIKKTNIAGKLINANENQKYIQDSIL